MQGVMAQTKLPREVCAHIWELSNPNGDEVFTRQMFMIAMHLLYKKKKDPSLALPACVLPELVQSSADPAPQQAAPTIAAQQPSPQQRVAPSSRT